MKTRSSKEFSVEGKMEHAENEKVEEPEIAYTLKDVDRAKELFAEGKRDLFCGNVAEAAKSLSEVCTIFAGYYGETADECADPCYYYGRTLFELARKEPDVVANAVEGVPLGGDDSESESDEANGVKEADATQEDSDLPEMDQKSVREQVMEALDENSKELEAMSKEDSSKSNASDSPPNASEAVEKVAEGNDAEDGEGNDETGSEEGDEVPEEISNLQLSWEMLDLARVIWEKSNNDTSKQRLTDCRLALGEHAIEDGKFDTAVSELNDCLSMQKDILQPDDRRIAVCYFNIALAHSFNQKYDDSIDAFNAATAVLELRRENLVKKSNGEGIDEQEKAELEDETKELTTLIADIQNRLQDCVESRSEEVTSKQELQKFESGDNGVSSSTSGLSPPTDVSHLVRKSVKHAANGDGTGGDTAPKKQKLDDQTAGEVNTN